MLEKLGTYITILLFVFMAGWYAALHQTVFWTRLGWFGAYMQEYFDKVPKCPAGFVCRPVPSPSYDVLDPYATIPPH